MTNPVTIGKKTSHPQSKPPQRSIFSTILQELNNPNLSYPKPKPNATLAALTPRQHQRSKATQGRDPPPPRLRAGQNPLALSTTHVDGYRAQTPARGGVGPSCCGLGSRGGLALSSSLASRRHDHPSRRSLPHAASSHITPLRAPLTSLLRASCCSVSSAAAGVQLADTDPR